jgi:hypothetical protein
MCAPQGHSADCVELFHAAQVAQSLRSMPAPDDAVKHRTEAALKQYLEGVMFGDDPDADDPASDDAAAASELPDEVRALFEAIAIDGAVLPLEDLPVDLRRQFERAVADGSVSSSIPGSSLLILALPVPGYVRGRPTALALLRGLRSVGALVAPSSR